MIISYALLGFNDCWTPFNVTRSSEYLFTVAATGDYNKLAIAVAVHFIRGTRKLLNLLRNTFGFIQNMHEVQPMTL
jgi:hypothetical protein